MTPELTISKVDTRGLSQVLAEMAGIFTARGGSASMIQQFIRSEAGQLAADAANILGPKNVTKAKDKAESNVKSLLNSDFSDQAGEAKYTTFTRTSQMESSYPDWHWLTAGPNFLLGVKNQDLRPDADGDEAMKIFRAAQKSGARGKSYVRIGTHVGPKGNRQAVMQLNRVRVSKSAFAKVKQSIYAKFGEAKASFAATAIKLLPGKTFPAFVMDKLAAVEESGKTIFDDSGLSDAKNPSITFGSRAPGVESNPYMVDALQRAVKNREYRSAAKLEKLIKGAVYNLKTGQVYMPNRNEVSEPEEGWI